MIELLRAFYEEIPEFKTVPLYIFGESYGGKMAIEFARDLFYEIQDGKIESNLAGVAMGDAWISPVDSTLSWAPYLLHLGFIDEDGFDRINRYAVRTKKALDNGNFYQSTDLWYQTETVLADETKGVDFYNVLTKIPYRTSSLNAKKFSPRQSAFDLLVLRSRIPKLEYDENDADDEERDLSDLMRTDVHQALGLDDKVKWGSQAGIVFDTLSGDFMKPVVDVVAEVLTNTTIKVIVYSGQLDLICSTPGTVEWVNNMEWYGREGYMKAPRQALSANNYLEGYKRSYDRFTMYWVSNSENLLTIRCYFNLYNL